MNPCKLVFCLALVMALTLSGAALAAWPEDAASDLFIGDGPGEQAVPHLVLAENGASYAGWYDNSSGNYNLAVQRLDAQGNEIWVHNGLLASDQPQDSWVMDWDLAAAGDDAITAVRDIRTGNPTVSVNRITAAGNFPWGAHGIQVASNSAFIGPPNLAVAGDGDVIVVWEEHPGFGAETIRIQRIAPDGTLRYAGGGLVVHGSSTESPGRPQVIAAGASDVIVSWVPDDAFMGDRQVAVRKFNAAGDGVWIVPITVFDGGSLPMGHNYTLMGDGAGGSLVAWESGIGVFIYSYIQHLDADGQWLFPYGGVRVSTDNNHNEYSPQVAHDQVSGDLLIFWTQADGNQNLFGVKGQKFSATGDRLWGDAGRTFVPISSTHIDFMAAAAHPGGVTVAWNANVSGAWGDDEIVAMLTDYEGNVVWDPSPIAVASTLSIKSNLRAVGTDAGAARLIWKDERHGTPDIAAKSVNVDGTFGGGTVGIEDEGPADEIPVVGLTLDQNYPNPFNPLTTIAFAVPRTQHVRVTIHDLQGRLVRTLVDGTRQEGRHELRWAGETDAGDRAASGGYIYRLQTEERVLGRTMVLTK